MTEGGKHVDEEQAIPVIEHLEEVVHVLGGEGMSSLRKSAC
jgi:hypothetical protein